VPQLSLQQIRILKNGALDYPSRQPPDRLPVKALNLTVEYMFQLEAYI